MSNEGDGLNHNRAYEKLRGLKNDAKRLGFSCTVLNLCVNKYQRRSCHTVLNGV